MDSRKASRIVAKKLGIPAKTIEEVYKRYWEYIKDRVEKMPFNDEDEFLTEEEFKKLNPAFYIKGIGYLYCSYKYYKNTKKRLEEYNRNAESIKTDKSKADV